MTTESKTRVYTIGHSKHSVERLLALLARQGIEVVVDVRSTPYSRYNPQFNREPLAQAMEAAGLRYLHEGNRLGGAPTDPTCYVRVDTGGSASRETRQVDWRLVTEKDWFQAAMDELTALARANRVAVLCAEEDPERCHRHHLLTPALVGRDAEVLHIRATGETEPARLSPEARQLSLF
jgi:uncharacterized protein (DUF488 family)